MIIFEDGMLVKTSCNYPGKPFARHPKKNGTTSLHNHLSTSKKHPHNMDTQQAISAFQQSLELGGTQKETSSRQYKTSSELRLNLGFGPYNKIT